MPKRRHGPARTLLKIGVLATLGWPGFARADALQIKRDGKLLKLQGNVLAKDRSGSILFETRDGAHHLFAKTQFSNWEKSAEKVPLYSRQQLRKAVERDLGGGFRFLQTTNYLVCFSGETEYAQEAGQLLERAYANFTNYFIHKGGFRFERPPQPLVAVLCASREEYLDRVRGDLGAMAASTSGVYVRSSNRLYVYDAFGGKTGQWVRETKKVNAKAADNVGSILRSRNISVVIHEAVHQIAFNVGFHHRHGNPPTWLTEGMAMFFEAPDLDASGGWRGAGSVHHERLAQLERNFHLRKKDSLTRLVIDDDRFRHSQTALDSYAEAWGLTYFLATVRPSAYVRYVKLVNARPPMVAYAQKDRLEDFERAFGKSPESLDADFRRFIVRFFSRQGEPLTGASARGS